MKKEWFSVRTMVATGICSAIFLVLAYFVNIPTPIPNTTIQVTYAFLAFAAALFGPVAGFFIGLIGHTIKDFMTYGAWWSWIIASAVSGCIMGLAMGKLNLESGKFDLKQIIKFNIYQVIANVAAWFVVAPVLDILIYSEPTNVVFVQGAVAGISNILCVAVLGTLLLFAYSKTNFSAGSLKRDQ